MKLVIEVCYGTAEQTVLIEAEIEGPFAVHGQVMQDTETGEISTARTGGIVTHIRSGRRIGKFGRRSDAEEACQKLAAIEGIDWGMISPIHHCAPELKKQVRAIVGK